MSGSKIEIGSIWCKKCMSETHKDATGTWACKCTRVEKGSRRPRYWETDLQWDYRMFKKGKGKITLKQLEELVQSCKARNAKSVAVQVSEWTGEGNGTYESPHVMKTKNVGLVSLSDETPTYAKVKEAEHILELSIDLKQDKH